MPHNSTPPTRFQFDPTLDSTGHYIDTQDDDNPVPFLIVRNSLEEQIEDARDRMSDISLGFIQGDLTLSEAQILGMREIKLINIIAAALASGGWAQMSQADWDAAGVYIRDQFIEFEEFLNSVASDQIRLTRIDGQPNGNLLRHFDLFVQSAVGMFAFMQLRRAGAGGATHELRILDDRAAHCDCCLSEAGHPELIGVLRQIGACTCVHNCRCHKVVGSIVSGRFVEG